MACETNRLPYVLFLTVSLTSPVTAPNPTGIKVRLTDKLLEVVKDFGEKYLKELKRKTFRDFELPCGKNPCKFKRLTVDDVKWKKVDLHFTENSDLHMEINDLQLSGNLQNNLHLWFIQNFDDEGQVTFKGRNVNAMTEMHLSSTSEGRLKVEILKCEVKVDLSVETSGHVLSFVWDIVRELLNDFLEKQLCYVLQATVQNLINIVLEDHRMELQKDVPVSILKPPNPPIYHVILDYSLSGAIKGGSHSLDVPLRGILFLQGEDVNINSIRGHSDSEIRENDMMVYFGISEFFFNSIIMQLQKSGPFYLDVPAINTIFVNRILNNLGLPEGPVLALVTEGSSVTVSEEGISANVEGVLQSELPDNLPIAVMCKIDLKLQFKDKHLGLSHNKANCDINRARPTLMQRFVDPMKGLAKIGIKQLLTNKIQGLFEKDDLIPLPEGVQLIDGKINYYQGFAVVGANLEYNPEKENTPAPRADIRDYGR